jgi:glycosyltransferase involved in cell wall biosynthesis
MACGTPVVTGDNSSLPEAAGDAAWLVNVEDVAGLAQAMAQAITDPQMRGEMIQRGYAHAGCFTWQNSAAALVAAYRTAAA